MDVRDQLLQLFLFKDELTEVTKINNVSKTHKTVYADTEISSLQENNVFEAKFI